VTVRTEEVTVCTSSVFVSERAAGNPTGVIVGVRFTSEIEQGIAQMLGYPDTVFLSPKHDDGCYESETYSPSEAIAFCVQSLLAAGSTLELAREESCPITFRVRGRDVQVFADVDAVPGRYWVRMNENRRLADLAPEAVRDSIGVASRVQVVDAGRRRAFVRLESLSALEAIEPTPASVMRFCRQQQLHGLCAFVLTGARDIALRVFTTSLDGREDAATGGAVAGLHQCCPEVARDADRPWRIEQGTGLRHRRGTLYLRAGSAGVFVGGVVQQIMRGTIFPQTWSGL
jgi:predicted PhzF superfamily epimerase YddE/YHI9